MSKARAKPAAQMTEIERALTDPSSVFESPEALLSRRDVARATKIEILRRWEYDARELQVAEEENMAGGEPDLLDRVLKALERLQASDDGREAPTKQGGA